MSKWLDAIGSSLTTPFQFGVGGSGWRSSSGILQARNAANNAYATIQSKDEIVNGAWEIRQSSKPTTRPDSSALVTGDRWLDASNVWWFWNGTYWLSEQIFQSVLIGSSITVTTTFGAFYPPSGYNVYLIDLLAAAVFVATQDTTSNYWQFQLDRVNNANPSVFTNISTISANTLTVSSNYVAASYVATINTQIDLTALNVKLFRFVCNKVGSAGTLGQFTATIRYRLCQP